MNYRVGIYKAHLPMISVEAPFAQAAARDFDEKYNLNDKVLIEVRNEIGFEVFEINHLKLLYVRPVNEN